MQWLNEPEKWSAEGNTVQLFVTPKTDFWRKTHYGFVVDDGPFYYKMLGGEFETSVQIEGDYQTRYDQMGLMIRKDETTWIKTGIEFVNDRLNLSAVVTHERSDWSIIELPIQPNSIRVKAVRRLDAVEISYSLDGGDYKMMRHAYFPQNCPVMVGVMAASPDGDGFDARFRDFQVRHLPDQRRLAWLDANQ
ncbi:MAG: DUF1349 domain-containing protein [Bacteroidota bacterium]